ncbi:MAG: hypothetical protein KY461_00525 [Actinobacteria bacterium]|nr:hypothetical protein [Actinomycetota bacterium]
MTRTSGCRERPRGRFASEHGGIVTGWLFQLLIIMAIIGVLGHEVISIGVTSVNLEDDARDVAVAARDAYGRGDLDAAKEAAAAAASQLDAELLSLEVDGETLVATVTKQADTFFVHRIGPLEDLTTPTARGRVRWR